MQQIPHSHSYQLLHCLSVHQYFSELQESSHSQAWIHHSPAEGRWHSENKIEKQFNTLEGSVVSNPVGSLRQKLSKVRIRATATIASKPGSRSGL